MSLYADSAAVEHRHQRTYSDDSDDTESVSDDSSDSDDEDDDDDDDDDRDNANSVTNEHAKQKSWLGKCYGTYMYIVVYGRPM